MTPASLRNGAGRCTRWWTRPVRWAAASALLTILPTAVPAQDLLALGRHLANECTSCHRRDGADKGIPSITGWNVDEFVTTMGYYRDGARPNPAMRSVAQSLSEQETQALAIFFATLPKPARQSSR